MILILSKFCNIIIILNLYINVILYDQNIIITVIKTGAVNNSNISPRIDKIIIIKMQLISRNKSTIITLTTNTITNC